MDRRIKEVIDLTKDKFGLDHYYLQTYKFYRKVTIFKETVYTLCMEWFPNHVTELKKDGSNPEGTAVIDVALNHCRFESVIFVGGKSFANGVKFVNSNRNNIIKWIENETGLLYGIQFQLDNEAEGELRFQTCFNGVAVSPSGLIEIEFNQDGRLTFFSVNGPFPVKEKVKEETYTLSFEKVEHLAKEQLKLLEFPSYEKKQFIPVYAIEEIYIKNDQTATMPFEFMVVEKVRLKIDEMLFWDTRIKKTFIGKEINILEDILAEQAFSCEPHPDLLPITELEQRQCIIAVKDFLRQVYPDDTGKWLLKTTHRDKGYIHATLRLSKQDYRVFERKLLVMIDAKSFQAVNYIDNKPMLEIFDQFLPPEKVLIHKEEAYEKMIERFELKPFYVYNFEQKQYVLCGKLDCQYGVNASSGKVVVLDDL